MTQKWKILYRSNDKIIWINYINSETKICYLTYKDQKTPLPKGWERWFSTSYQLFYYRYIDNNGSEQIQWKSPKTSNQYNYSPKIESSTFIDLELKDDLKKIYDIHGHIDLIWKAITIPCIIKKTVSGINIRIIGEDDCLEFSIDNDKNAYIHILNVADNDCPGPKERQGSFFLLFVDEICRQLEVKSLKLSDESSITSKDGSKDGLTVSLEFLSLMKYGLSWYERNGFSYQNKTKKDIVNKIRNTPISEIKAFLSAFANDLDHDKKQLELRDKWKKKDLENWYVNFPEFLDKDYLKYINSLSETTHSHDPTQFASQRTLIIRNNRFKTLKASEYDFSELPSKIKNTLVIISNYEEDEEYTDTLSGFLTYVWNKNNSNNFEEYIEIMSVLYPDISGGKMYIDESILPAFPTDSYMIKVFSI